MAEEIETKVEEAIDVNVKILKNLDVVPHTNINPTKPIIIPTLKRPTCFL